MVCGGLAGNGNGDIYWSSASSVVTYSIYGIFNKFSNGPKLYTPRAMAKGIYVNGKTYVSGNYNNDDSTMEVLEEGATEFKPVGKTSPRMKPYMFADSLGRVMVTSAYNNYGGVAEFYTDDNGNQMLIGDLYDPSTGQTRRIGLIDFTPKNLPMLLPDDAKSEDYRVTYDNGSHRHFILTCSVDGDYMLHNLNMEDLMLGFFDDFEIPSKDKATGLDITWRGSVIANQKRKEVYLIGTSGPMTNQTLHIISFSYRTLDWTIASASGFKHDMLTAAWTLLNDGRLACTGGVVGHNIDAQAATYIFNPPVAGTTEVSASTLTKDDAGNYLIGSVSDWRDFADLVQQTPKVNAVMTADIDLGSDQTMIGTPEVPFEGTFNGKGHTLTVHYESTEDGIAPFRYTKNATFEGIHVAGSIHTTGYAVSGLIVNASLGNEQTVIRQCWVSVRLEADVIEGPLQNSLAGFCTEFANNGVIEDCLFDGVFADKNIRCGGGFVNYSSFPVTIRNSLNLGTFPNGRVEDGCATFVRTDYRPAEDDKLEKVYFLNPYGLEQGLYVSESLLADGTVTGALQAKRAEQVWVQDATTGRPMLKVFTNGASSGGEGGLCVVVENTNGEKVRYLLEEDPRFYLKGQTVTVVTSKVTIDYQTDDIARVYLEDYTPTDINELPALKEGSMSIEAGRIVITGLESGETATVYQLSGTPVTTAKADQEGRIVISIDGTPGKVSIVKTKHQSFKIIRK
jgi:hypothetical protein